MNKYLFSFMLLFSFLFCHAGNQQEKETDLYHVYKIDSVNNYYTVYLRKGDEKYKVVSKMEYRLWSEKIEVNKEYPFSLEIFWEPGGTINGIEMMANHVRSISLDIDTSIGIEIKDSIYVLHKAKNLAGLYLIK